MKTFALVPILVVNLLAAPLAAEAQPAGKLWRIGLLGLGTPPACESDIAPPLLALRRGLDDLGYVEGANFVFVTRCPASVADAMPSARALAALNPDVIVTFERADGCRKDGNVHDSHCVHRRDRT
jgi:hypothetical protein